MNSINYHDWIRTFTLDIGGLTFVYSHPRKAWLGWCHILDLCPTEAWSFPRKLAIDCVSCSQLGGKHDAQQPTSDKTSNGLKVGWGISQAHDCQSELAFWSHSLLTSSDSVQVRMRTTDERADAPATKSLTHRMDEGKKASLSSVSERLYLFCKRNT